MPKPSNKLANEVDSDSIKNDIDAASLHQMIAEAAYYRAEARGFCCGDPRQDWLEAEAEILGTSQVNSTNPSSD